MGYWDIGISGYWVTEWDTGWDAVGYGWDIGFLGGGILPSEVGL